jgi:hypothetical protein
LGVPRGFARDPDGTLWLSSVSFTAGSQLYRESRQAITVGQVRRALADGTITKYLPDVRLEGQTRLSIRMEVVNPDGTVARPEDPTAWMLDLAARDDRVAEALRYFDRDTLQWWDLYKVFSARSSRRSRVRGKTANKGADDCVRHARDSRHKQRHDGSGIVDAPTLAGWRSAVVPPLRDSSWNELDVRRASHRIATSAARHREVRLWVIGGRD